LAGVANEAYPVLVTQQEVAADRKRFTLAHELGHLLMDTSGITSSREEEHLANRFAAAFLVPREVAIRELGQKRARLSFEELKLLKQKHGLSMQAWLYRARDLAIIEEGHFNTLYVNLCAYGWRRQEPGEYKGREEQTRFRQMVYRALAEDIIDIDQAAGWCPELKERTVFSATKNETRQDMGPRTVYNLPLGRREAVLREAAAALADVYRPGAPAVVGDVFDDPEDGGRGDAQ
jgi:Zn-dependent peptidase ImmA (M78 family)